MYRTGSYYHTCTLLRGYLGSDRIPHWKYVKPLKHKMASRGGAGDPVPGVPGGAPAGVQRVVTALQAPA